MEWLHCCYAHTDRRNKVLRFLFPNEKELLLEGYNSSCPNLLISNNKTNKMMSKGLLCHLVRVNDVDHYIPSTDSVAVVNEFQDVFLGDLP